MDVGERIELRLPDGSRLESEVAGIPRLRYLSNDPEPHFDFVLPQLTCCLRSFCLKVTRSLLRCGTVLMPLQSERLISETTADFCVMPSTVFPELESSDLSSQRFAPRTPMAIIFHITKREEWERAKREGIYKTPSLASEGFIHCSTSDQVIRTANRLFSGQMGLVLLEIDTNLVRDDIRYENCEGGQENFPHIYGALNLDSVVRVVAFEPEETRRIPRVGRSVVMPA